MIYREKENEHEAIMDVARFMVTAARTAPKGCGEDHIVACIVDGQEKDQLSSALREICRELGPAGATFDRDADCIDLSQCLVLIGIRDSYLGLGANCQLCGYADCGACAENAGMCAIKVTDLGIALGSAVSVAADHRIDNRIFYTAGRGAVRCGFLGEDVRLCYGIPLSASGKSVFFDRGGVQAKDVMWTDKQD